MTTERIVCVFCGREGHRAAQCPMRAPTELYAAAAPQPCMGGWCGCRSGCPHYLTTDRRQPAERLCMPGADGVGADAPIRFHRPVGTWERSSGPLGQAVDSLGWL